MNEHPGNEPPDGRSQLYNLVAGASVLIAISTGFVLYYRTRVCDEQLSAAGGVVTICRSLQVTDPPITVLALIILIALTVFFSEVSGFGISLKREVAQASRVATAAKLEAASAKQDAQSAQRSSESAEEVALAMGSRTPDTEASAQEGIVRLVQEYNNIRATLRSGAERTTKMTAVVSRMISLLSGINRELFDFADFIADADDKGRRLAAYAYAYASADPLTAPALVTAIMKEQTPFGQYWAIRALRRVINSDSSALDFNSRRQLDALLTQLGPGSDRAYELRRVLSGSEQK